MDVFRLRNTLISDYRAYSKSFVRIRDPRIHAHVETELESGALWPDPLIQLNPRFESGKSVQQLADAGLLHPLCAEVFRFGKSAENPAGFVASLHKHQVDAIEAARAGDSYVLITGTGSGKSLAYIIPIVDHALRNKQHKGIKAVIVYPMNALANSQLGELRKFLEFGFSKPPVTFARYTGQETDQQRNAIKANPPDILLTNYVMLEYIMTRPDDSPLVQQMRGMQFLVLDELHTYRGRQGADVALLARRVRDVADNPGLQMVGTSATLAGGETFADQQAQVSAVAAQLLGVKVKPERVIGETLTRMTPLRDHQDPAYLAVLKERLAPGRLPPTDKVSFFEDPLSSWIETMFGLESEPGSDRLRRATPLGVAAAAAELSRLTGVARPHCAEAITSALLAREPGDREEGPPTFFAFRLHQFISRGDTVYTSLEEAAGRYISLSGQKYVPGDRSRLMLPLAFCRECGQEYYVVTRRGQSGKHFVEERDLRDQARDAQGENRGFLYRGPWQDNDADFVFNNVPDSWVVETTKGRRLTPTGRQKLPIAVRLNTLGEEDPQGALFHFIPQPFAFCLYCGVAYGPSLRSDYTKLSSLSAGGRSTATTVLALSALRTMRQEHYLEERARKLLSFTDNRQDASLQAGHTNDFVEVGLLRSALFRAMKEAGDQGLTHDNLPRKLFAALGLPFHLYAADPAIEYGRDDVDHVLRQVLAYRVYQDQRGGLRVTAPNLEQSGLLTIEYKHLSELCADDIKWANAHPALAGASPTTREQIGRTLLDWMRRELAIHVDFLSGQFQEGLQYRSSQNLVEPWAIDDTEPMTVAAVAFPSTQSALTGKHRFDNIYISEYGGFGQYLRRADTFPRFGDKITTADTLTIIRQLLQRLRLASLVEVAREVKDINGQTVPGYQVKAAALIWKAGDGTRPYHDRIRVPRLPAGGSAPNQFFVDFYARVAAGLTNMKAREHTAQVPADVRQAREEEFREARLPILYCSPTMELGVDIAQLNVVNMRNVPPTPANYAQRSGRAGRSGQPALVFTYCTTGSPHDQYHFRRPGRMVSGQVSTPRLELGNEDLIRAHVHSIWLSDTGASLGKSLRDVLDLNQPDKLPLQHNLLQQLTSPSALQRARQKSQRILSTVAVELENAPWYDAEWLDRQLQQVVQQLDRACDRWRGLFQAAREQQRIQNDIAKDPSRSAKDRQIAAQLRKEAETQLSLLADESNIIQSDFYSYRYLASEGFLPGYNFPRLPLSAYIPARRGRSSAADEFVNRPRFLAITEFGPRSLIYHEGSKYIINKVILPVGYADGDEVVLTSRAKLCPACGYLHPVSSTKNSDLCDRCGAPLTRVLNDLFRMQNVSTRRRERISSDEEERLRQGYDVVSGVRFADYGQLRQEATVEDAAGDELWKLTYGDAATLWRINLGWARRQNRNEHGFWLDIERGYWQRSESEVDSDEEDPISPSLKRVVPYVEDWRNALLLQPAELMDRAMVASLESALQKAIQAIYQLEDGELAVESLPAAGNPRLILMYEASEGGAGVLRQLLQDQTAMATIAEEALRICHFDPASGVDVPHLLAGDEVCEAACYDCLMSYYNQPDHRILDRRLIRDALLALRDGVVKAGPGALTRAEHLARLYNLCGSQLERDWLDRVDQLNLRLPNDAQRLIESCGVSPDFYYDVDGYHVAVFVDGPHHDDPAQQAKDIENDEKLWNAGIEPIHFHYLSDWAAILAGRKGIFGQGL